MARLNVNIPGGAPLEVELNPGCNRVGSDGSVEIVLPHPSVSGCHCELWLTEEAVLIRNLDPQHGTFVDNSSVAEGQVLEGQTVRIGDVELLLVNAPVRISVPELQLPPPPKPQLFMEDGTPCCYIHDGVVAKFQCASKCGHAFCGRCVRELRVAGGMPRRFCPECGGQCERLAPASGAAKRGSWLDKIKKAFTQPVRR